MVIRMQRLHETLGANGDSRSAHYLNMSKGLWTRGVKIGVRSVAWPQHENEALISARIAGFSEEEIRKLVCTLEADRTRKSNSKAGG